jgi:dynein heavy chain
MNVDPMYQYSLKFFCMIYERALDRAEGKVDKNERNKRKDFFIKKFTSLLYKNVCRSLFEKDKLLFSFLMCMKIMEEQGTLDTSEARFLMTGATSVDMPRPNPSGANGWLSDKAWISILEMSRAIPAFTGLDKDFEKYITDWERVYNSPKPQSLKEIWPGQWQELTMFRRLLLLRILRPDKIIPAIVKLVKKDKELGKKYTSPPPFDLTKSFSDSTNKTPVIFVLSPGADPMTELQKLSVLKNVKWASLSLGQGQSEKAKEAILLAQDQGTWVVLQNCHLAPSFMPILDGIIEQIAEDKGSNFRLWLTSMPSEKFPVSIL